MLEGISTGQIGNSASRGSKHCQACSTIFGRPLRQNEILREDVCKKCRRILKSGATIFISSGLTDNRMITLRAKDDASVKINPKYAGTIVRVTPEWLDQLEKAIAGTPHPE